MVLSGAELAKSAAAQVCVEKELCNGMHIGVGSGSTVKFLIESLREAVSSGKIMDIKCVPTSYQTREWLRAAQLPIYSLDSLHELDIAIDGADEVDKNLTCIKGGGGCLLQEKLVQSCAKKFVVIADKAKFSNTLGSSYAHIPIEVVPYGATPVKKWITEKFGGECIIRMDKRGCFPSITENHNYIFDWEFPKPVPNDFDWCSLNQKLISITGVVETGLFIGVADIAYFGTSDRTVDIVTNKNFNRN